MSNPTASQALVRSPVSFEGTVQAGPSLLRSPVSGQPCVHWRLRIVEHLTYRTQLVHELSSSEPFELAWAGGGPEGRPPVRIRLEPEAARIHATPVLHRPGTPGAAAAAQAFGFAGPISVEEVMIRHGEAVSAEGVLEDPGSSEGPFRSVARGLELIDATVRVDARGLGFVLLPWALGTAAALMGGLGLAGYALWRWHRTASFTGRGFIEEIVSPARGDDDPRLHTPPLRFERGEIPHPRLP